MALSTILVRALELPVASSKSTKYSCNISASADVITKPGEADTTLVGSAEEEEWERWTLCIRCQRNMDSTLYIYVSKPC